MILRLKLILFCLCFTVWGKSQGEDFQIWSGVSIEKEISNDVSIKFKTQPRFNQNGRHFKQLINQLELKHKVTNWMRVSLRFRHANSSNTNYMRYTGTITFRYDLRKIKFRLRNQIQDQWDTYGLQKIETKSNLVAARARLNVGYKLNKHFLIFVSTEPIFEIKSGLSLLKWRYGAGTSIRITKKLDFELQYYYQNDFPELGNQPSIDHIFINGLSYEF